MPVFQRQTLETTHQTIQIDPLAWLRNRDDPRVQAQTRKKTGWWTNV